MVSEDFYLEGRASKVVFPSLQSSDYCQEFLVVDVIILFCRGECLGEVRARVPVTT